MRDFLTRWTYRLIALAFVLAIGYVLYLFFPWSAFRFDQLDPRLPEAFHLFDNAGIFWGWVVALLASAVWAGFRVRALFRRISLTQEDRELEAARGVSAGAPSEEVVLPPGAETADPVYLFLAPTDVAVRELLRAAGVELIGRSALTIQPRRAILINGASLSLLGRPDLTADSSPDLEALCRAVLARDPELPTIRGLFVVLPVEGTWRKDPAITARRIYHDLQTVRRILRIEPPVYLRFTGVEQKMPAFVELARLRGQRDRNEPVQGRWGVSFSRREREGVEGDDVFRRLAEYRFRSRRRALELLAQNPLETDRNRRLVALDTWLGALIGPISSLVVVAFPAADPDRPFLRAIDVVAAGTEVQDQAYAYSSVFKPLLEDGDVARWTRDALAEDRRYRQRAARIAGISGLMALLVWLYVELGIDSLGWLGWVAFAVFLTSWVAVPLLLWAHWPNPYPSRPGRARSS